MDRLAGVARARCLRPRAARRPSPHPLSASRRRSSTRRSSPAPMPPPALPGRPTRACGRSRSRSSGAPWCPAKRPARFHAATRPSRRTAGRASTRSSGSCARQGSSRSVYIAAAPSWAIDAHRRRRPSRPAAVPGLRARRRAALLGPGKRGPARPLLAGLERAEQGRQPGVPRWGRRAGIGHW